MLLEPNIETLEFPEPSSVVTQAYIDFLAKNFRLSHNGHHGLEHWLRVLINGRLLADVNGADIQVVEHFALVHDIGRINEHYDVHHGEQAAKFVKSFSKWFNLDEHQLYLLTEACKYHSAGRIIPNVTIQTCWDADRLDLGRVGIKPKAAYLGTPLARDQKFLEQAYARSKMCFVLEGFSDD